MDFLGHESTNAWREAALPSRFHQARRVEKFLAKVEVSSEAA
jgi:hypothetical protein